MELPVDGCPPFMHYMVIICAAPGIASLSPGYEA
jgi:hypothetical protein